jgi:predicted helicase
LASANLATTDWKPLSPSTSFYLFVPQNIDLRQEYEQGWKINEIFSVNSVGVVTARDSLTIQWSQEQVWQTVNEFINLPVEQAREHFRLGPDARDWKVSLAQEDIRRSGPDLKKVVPILYRPFDVRYTYYTGHSRGFICMPRPEVMKQMISNENIGLHLCRQTSVGNWGHVLLTFGITDDCYVSNLTSERGYTFPLYLVSPSNGNQFQLLNELRNTFESKSPNINSDFIEKLSQALNLVFISDKSETLPTAFGSEEIFNYIYAILHSPTYRSRYAEFLKMDFPRIPLTHDVGLFRVLCGLGAELVGLHLLKSPKVKDFITRYPIPGDNRVEKGFPRYSEKDLRVYINKNQYFEGIPPDVWDYKVGGYQVLDKWLKDRRGRQLTFDDLTHYQEIVVALAETIRLMAEIDRAIPEWPIA